MSILLSLFTIILLAVYAFSAIAICGVFVLKRNNYDKMENN